MATLLKDGNPRCHHERFAYIVGYENRGLTQLGSQAEKMLLQFESSDRVERGEGLIHQQHPWIGRKGASDSDPLLFTSRELPRVASPVIVQAGAPSPS